MQWSDDGQRYKAIVVLIMMEVGVGEAERSGFSRAALEIRNAVEPIPAFKIASILVDAQRRQLQRLVGLRNGFGSGVLIPVATAVIVPSW